jgi:hypothetical protein
MTAFTRRPPGTPANQSLQMRNFLNDPVTPEKYKKFLTARGGQPVSNYILTKGLAFLMTKNGVGIIRRRSLG